jgi:hypothetical protein
MEKTLSLRLVIPVIALAMVLSLPFFVFGHGDGESLEKEVDGYLIDIGYNTTEFIVGSSVVFEFDISKEEESVDFDDVWVRISEGNKTVFASGIYNAEFGGARMTYSFPSEGAYEFSVRFQDGSESITEAVFPIEVLPNSDEEDSQNWVLTALLGALVGAVAGVAAVRLMK